MIMIIYLFIYLFMSDADPKEFNYNKMWLFWQIPGGCAAW